MKLHIDIESRSPVDLTKAGQYVYAADPRTQITVACWSVDGAPVATWLPLSESTPPAALLAAIRDPAAMFNAHNAGFERNMLGGPPGADILPPDVVAALHDIDRWDCTAARAAAFGLPRSLDGASMALRLPAQKDKEGYTLMRRMMRPHKKTQLYYQPPEAFVRLGVYCAVDVLVEMAIDNALPALSAIELEIWRMTERMNDRGIAVDSEFLVAVAFLIEDSEREINRAVQNATGGAVMRASDHRALTRWLISRGVKDPGEHAAGEEPPLITGTNKATVAGLLATGAQLDPLVREVLVLRQEGGKSSVAKYRAILARLSADNRARGSLVFCGAPATKRWASRGIQTQNMSRVKFIKNILAAIRDVLSRASRDDIEFLHGPPLVVAAELMRSTFVAAAGHWMARGDYSQIEARVLAWLSGAAWKLAAFVAYDNGTGPDIYRIGGGSIYRKAPAALTDEERQVGKVAELALGFQGAVGALQAMARLYGVEISDETALEIVRAWRLGNPEIADHERGLWGVLERAAFDCVRRAPGAEWVQAGRFPVWFKRTADCMAMRGPSGGALFYWWPRIEPVMKPWGEKQDSVTFWGEDSKTKRFMKFSGYGGFWAQQMTQFTARELMADALVRLDRDGRNPVLTVHDEGVCEIPFTAAATAEDAAGIMESVMRQTPAWSAGLPVAAEASAALRYMKGK
jgi:DNA polymerase